jgi:hypothetical protein
MNEETPQTELTQEQVADITLQVSEFEMNALAKILKSKDITFRSERQLSAFVRKRLFKTSEGNTITYHYTELGSKKKRFLFQIIKTITTNEEGSAILNLNIELDEKNIINPATSVNDTTGL